MPEKFRSLGVASAAVVSHSKLMNAALSPSREVWRHPNPHLTPHSPAFYTHASTQAGIQNQRHSVLIFFLFFLVLFCPQFEAALAGALAYPRCRVAPGAASGAVATASGVDVSCLVDKAMVNLGAELCGIVSGRISHEIDGRLLHDKDKVLSKAKAIADLYREMGVPRSRLLIGVEATWEGIEAVKVLEAEGIECHVRSVFTLQQAAAALAAGAAVLQPAVLSISVRTSHEEP